MALSFSTALRNSRLDAISTAVGSGGKINIYAGTVPAVGTAITTEPLLAELTISGSFAAAATGAILTVSTITADTSANATNTATFFRVTTSGNTTVMQGTVGIAASGADLILNSTSLVTGAQVSISSFTITEANA